MRKKMAVIVIFCLFLGGCGSEPECPAAKELETESAESELDHEEEVEEPPEPEQADTEKTATQIMDDLFVDNEVQLQVFYRLGIEEDESESSIRSKLKACEYLVLDKDISSLEDLALLPSLKELKIQIYPWDHSKFHDFTPIAGLKELETLDISYKADSPIDYSFVTQLPNLENLYLPECGITDISFLSELTQLKRLSLYGNDVTDLTPLQGLSDLVELSLAGNGNISNMEFVGGLFKMEDMGLAYCNMTDIHFIADLKELKGLNINANQVTDISALKDLTKLERLGISENGIEDITPIKNLVHLWDLAMDGNKIKDISSLKNLKHLNQLGISNNLIEDLGVLQGMDELFLVNVFGNPLKSLKPVYQVPLVTFYGASAESEEEIKNQMEWVNDWMKRNVPEIPYFTCIDYSRGDINQDGLSDIAFVVDELSFNENNDDTEHDREFFRDNRILYLLLQNSDGTYRSVQDTPYISASGMGGMRGDPYRGIFLDDGRLVIQESSGSNAGGQTVTTIYRYQKDQLIETQELYVGDSGFKMGYDVTISQKEKGTWQNYAYAVDGYRLTRIFLADDKHPYFKAFPLVNQGMDFQIYDTPKEPLTTPTDALELAKEIYAPEAEKEMLPYTETLKADLERLKGISLPDYYYIIPGEEADKPEDYFYYADFFEYKNRPVHLINMVHMIPSAQGSSDWIESLKPIWIDDETGQEIKTD